MGIENFDSAIMRKALKELMQENKPLLKELLKEILIENEVIVSSEQAERRKKIERFINDDFDQYDEVFKALA